MAILAHQLYIKNQLLHDQYMVGPSDQFRQMLIYKDFLYKEFSNGNFFFSMNYNGGDNFFTRLSYYYTTSFLFDITSVITYC